MILYHFSTSPFARRVRLVMETKGLSAELRDPRVDAKHFPDLHRISPVQTVPTLIDGERVFTDSLAIVAHLEAKVPTPSVWPSREHVADAFEVVRLADRAIDTLVDLGMRFHPLHDHPGYAAVKTQLLARAQGALGRLAGIIEARGDAEYIVGDAWSYADIALVTLGMWLDGLPARAATFAPAKQMVALGWTVPAPLATWTAARRRRPDVATLG